MKNTGSPKAYYGTNKSSSDIKPNTRAYTRSREWSNLEDRQFTISVGLDNKNGDTKNNI